MRNMWKGLVIGGLTGAAAGLALDLGERGAQGVAQLGGAVASKAPAVVDHLRHSAGAAADLAADRAADVPTGARSAAAAAHDAVTEILAGSPRSTDITQTG